MTCFAAIHHSFLVLDSSCALTARWLSSVFVHQSFRHLLSNLLLFVALGWQVEKKYGTWRVGLLFWFAAIGGVSSLHSFDHIKRV